jgi:hypothetical protein
MELFKRTLTSRFAHRLGKVQQGVRYLGNSPGIRTPESLADVFATCWSFDSMSTELTDAIILLASWPGCGYGKKVNDSVRTSECMDER